PVNPVNIETILSIFNAPDLKSFTDMVRAKPDAVQINGALNRILGARADYNEVADKVASRSDEMSKAKSQAAEKVQAAERALEAAKAEHRTLTEGLNALRSDLVVAEIAAKAAVTADDVELVISVMSQWRAAIDKIRS